jgi:hypothetical protein
MTVITHAVAVHRPTLKIQYAIANQNAVTAPIVNQRALRFKSDNGIISPDSSSPNDLFSRSIGHIHL